MVVIYMSATHSSGGLLRSRPAVWMASIASFAVATALQVAIYGLVVPNRALSEVPGPIALVFAATWLVLPVTVASLLSFRQFRLVAIEPERRSASSLIALLVLPLLSVYLGVLLSFNIWGGK